MDNIFDLVQESRVAFSEMRKTKKYLSNDEYVIAVCDSLYKTMYSQIHYYLANLRDGEGESEIREHIGYVLEYVLPTLKDKLKHINAVAKKVKSQKFTEENKEHLQKLQEYYATYGKIYEDFFALSAFRNIQNSALYMEWGMPENDKVWKYNFNCF